MRVPRILCDRRAATAVVVLALLACAPARASAMTARTSAARAGAGAAPGHKPSQVPRVRIPFPQYDGTLTPYTFQLGYPLVMLIYDSLMWRDAQGVPQPWLARTVSQHGDTVTVRLRSGVRWQDGVPLTAADVVFTYRYLVTHPNSRFTPEIQDLVDVEQTAPDTAVFRLRGPSLGFEDQPLADVPILPEHLWAGLPAGQVAPRGLPVGSGPYRLVSSSPKTGYRFLANDGYFKGKPTVRQIDMPIVRNSQTMLNELATGTADAVPVELFPDELGSVQADLGVQIASGDSYTGTVLLLNTNASPFNDPTTRQAVADAIDQDALAASLGGATGTSLVVPADHGLIDPHSPWAPRRPLRSYAPNTARVGMIEQGEPPIVVLAPNDDPLRLAAGQQVVRQLIAVGARATLREVSAKTLDSDIGVNGSTPNYQAAIWTTPNLISYDPSFLGALFGPPSRTPLNYSGYTSPALNSLAAAVENAPTEAARHRAVDSELAFLSHAAPVVPLVFTRGDYAYRPGVYDGWVYVKGAGILDKQSFLVAGPRALKPPAPLRAEPALPGQDSGTGTLDIFGIAILGLLVLAVAWRMYGRRSTSFRRRR